MRSIERVALGFSPMTNVRNPFLNLLMPMSRLRIAMRSIERVALGFIPMNSFHHQFINADE